MLWSLHTRASSEEVAQQFAAEFFDQPAQVREFQTELNFGFGFRGFFRVTGCHRLYRLLGRYPGIWVVKLA